MSAGAIKAGEAFIKIWANDAEARKALKSLQGRVRAFADEVSSIGKSVGAVGLAISAPFAAAAKRFPVFASAFYAMNPLVG